MITQKEWTLKGKEIYETKRFTEKIERRLEEAKAVELEILTQNTEMQKQLETMIQWMDGKMASETSTPDSSSSPDPFTRGRAGYGEQSGRRRMSPVVQRYPNISMPPFFPQPTGTMGPLAGDSPLGRQSMEGQRTQ